MSAAPKVTPEIVRQVLEAMALELSAGYPPNYDRLFKKFPWASRVQINICHTGANHLKPMKSESLQKIADIVNMYAGVTRFVGVREQLHHLLT